MPTNTPLDAATLTSEERSMVDAEADGYRYAYGEESVRPWEDSYREGYELARPRIEARRAFFAPKASEASGNGDDYECPNCGSMIAHCWAHHGWISNGPHVSKSYDYSCQRPLPPAASPQTGEECAVDAHDFRNGNCMKCGKNVNPHTKPSPPAATEMELAQVDRAVHLLRVHAANSGRRGYRIDEMEQLEAADVLETFWRSRSVPATVTMTEELKRLLDAVEIACGYLENEGYPGTSEDLASLSAAVRASLGKPVAAKVAWVPHAEYAANVNNKAWRCYGWEMVRWSKKDGVDYALMVKVPEIGGKEGAE